MTIFFGTATQLGNKYVYLLIPLQLTYVKLFYNINQSINFIKSKRTIRPLTLQHRCDKRLQRLQKILCKRVYYFVNVYLNKNHERNEAKL